MPQRRRQRQPKHTDSADGPDDVDNRSSDTLMSDAPDNSNSHTRPKAVGRMGFTAINQPWRRNSHNAALFDPPISEGSYVTDHLRVAPLLPSKMVEAESKQDSVVGQMKQGDDDEAVIDEDSEEDEEPTINRSTLYATCEAIFSDNPKLLTGERLLQVASLYTNAEVVEKVRLHHPQATKSPNGITQALSDSLTRVAHQRGVAREVVKQELDRLRSANGVPERQVAFNIARREEAKKRAGGKGKVETQMNDGGGNSEPMEVDGDDAASGGDAARAAPAERVNKVATTPSGLGAGRSVQEKVIARTTPYGLGVGQPVEEKVIADSDEEEEL